MSLLRNCCFNWKVWTGAGAVLLVVLLVDPKALAAVFPVAVGLACPLSMGVMMWSMRSSGGSVASKPEAGVDTEARIAALQANIVELRAPCRTRVAPGEGGPAGVRYSAGAAELPVLPESTHDSQQVSYSPAQAAALER